MPLRLPCSAIIKLDPFPNCISVDPFLREIESQQESDESDAILDALFFLLTIRFLRKEVRKSRHFRHSMTNNNNRVAWARRSSQRAAPAEAPRSCPCPGRLGCVCTLFSALFFSAVTTLICIENDGGVPNPLPPRGRSMKFRMDKTLRFWVDVAYDEIKLNHIDLTKRQLVAQILRQYERRGHAMRCLDKQGKIAWKASPRFLTMLADAERDAQDELEELA
jgi:hypothetical protein